MKTLNYLKDKWQFLIAHCSAIANISIHLLSLFIYVEDGHYEITILCIRTPKDEVGALLHLSYIDGEGFDFDIFWISLIRHSA